MKPQEVDLAVFSSLDELVGELLARQRYEKVHAPLSEVFEEAEHVIACLDRLTALLHKIEDPRLCQQLAATWLLQREAQVLNLRAGSDDLVAVATVLLPRQAMKVIAEELE